MNYICLGLCFAGLVPAIAQHHSTAPDSTQTPILHGTVIESVNQKRMPLQGATVRWASGSIGTLTDSVGHFSIPVVSLPQRLIVSYVGYQTDTLRIADAKVPIEVLLKAEQTLQAVTVTAQAGQIERINPIHTEHISQRTLAKAACCNLSESFETNASVSVSMSDAVTGARQIQFLGLGGQYVQTNVENIPTIRGLATSFGLNYLPGTWITGIDIGKGAGSVVNGYESMSGQLNVELFKPDEPNRLLLNGYANSFGRLEGNANWAKPMSKRWSTALLGHASTGQLEIDQNNDGFRDIPLFTQLNAVNRYKYASDRLMAQFGVKALYEGRQGGQLAQFGNGRYRFDNTTRRLEFFAKTAVLYPDKPYRGLGLILNGVWHDQQATIGLRPYTGQQQTIYANLIYQTILGNTNHTVRTGLSYVGETYSEQFARLNMNRQESVPGLFGEYTYTYPEKLTVVVGARFDAHNLFGAQWTPRLHLRYNPWPSLTFRASAGRGFRAPNALNENLGLLVSSREVIYAAGLQPEISWNYGGSIVQDFQVFGKKASLAVDYFRTDFRQQLVVDADSPGKLLFYNLLGQSYANSWQAELNLKPIRRMEVKAAYRLFDVQQTMRSVSYQLLPRMMLPRDRVLLNAGYALPYDKWAFDATLQWNGPRRLPHTAVFEHEIAHALPVADLGFYSPAYATLHAQVSRGFRSGWVLYVGGENLTGFRQPNPILSADNPFGSSFDAASQVWGPVTGAMVYIGFRFKPVL